MCSSSNRSDIRAETQVGTEGKESRVTSPGGSLSKCLWLTAVQSHSSPLRWSSPGEWTDTSCVHTDGLFLVCIVALLLLVSWLSTVKPLWGLTLYWFTLLRCSLANESTGTRAVSVTLASPCFSWTFCTFTMVYKDCISLSVLFLSTFFSVISCWIVLYIFLHS